MNKTIFTLLTIFLLSFSFGINAATTTPTTVPTGAVPTGTILDTLLPSTKNCNYVTEKKYQPFSDITKNFPGAATFMVKGRNDVDCVNVTNGTENLLQLLFTTGITIVIVLTVISIAVAGIQYMTEQATGQIKGGAKKRLMNSFVALLLALMSYTILYTVNKQLVNFSFNPGSIDTTGAIDRGITDANNSALQSAAIAALVDAARPIATNGVGLPTPSPTGYVNKLTGAPCVPQVGPPAPGAPVDPCVKQDSLLGAYATAAPGVAQFTNINNPTLARASADGVLNVNGVAYNFRSGGGGNGYLPPGTYTVSNGYLRNDPASMVVDGFGYSFDLSDAYDPRTNAQRTLLRIHPDSEAPGTIGCIGIQGPLATQQQFYNSLQALLAANGGKYTIRVGM